ncbi:MAG: wax ester/triacylglycerol synthase family O-acyltransferase [Acidimicrobiales bacterium]|nr:wax ester/triacylglycerol synthase family O-acyltransferase [Acidimicrobiales bacterium]
MGTQGWAAMEPLSGLDAFFLYAETPSQHTHVTLVAVLDPTGDEVGFSFERVRDRFAERLGHVPPLTRRLQEMPLRLHHPVWVEDDHLDLDRHLHRVALPSPGSAAELADLVSRVASVPLPRDKPLWEAWVVEGLEHGQWALLVKMHHATIDGVSGVEQMVHLFDLDAAGTSLPAPERTVRRGPLPTTLELASYAAVSKALSLVDAVPLAGRTVGALATIWRRRSAGGTGGGTPLTAPPSPLNGAITGERRVAFARLSLDTIKGVRRDTGATVNDVVLTVCAGALRSYLERRGALPDQPLVAAVPVNVRTEDQRGRADNRVSALFAQLPVDLDDPLDRLEAVRASTSAAKEEHEVIGPDVLQGWAEVTDPTTMSLALGLYSNLGLADRHRPAVSLTISNVPGPPFPLYMVGSEIVRTYPLGPVIEGAGLNVSVISYRESVDVGFIAAGNLLPDLQLLADELGASLAELVTAVDAVAAG